MSSLQIDSAEWSKKAYLNYHCHGNTMHLSEAEMAQITKRWDSKLESWRECVKDNNEYDFDSVDYDNYKKAGEDKAKEKTGYDGNGTANAVVNTGAAVAKTVAVGLGTKIIGKKGMNYIRNKVVENGTGKIIDKIGTAKMKENALGITAKAGEKASAFVTIATAVVEEAIYLATKPNKEEIQACKDVQKDLKEMNETVAAQVGYMEEMAGELEELGDEANTYQEDGQEEITKEKTKYDMYMEMYQKIKAKVESGEELAPEEIQMIKDVMPYIEEAAANVAAAAEETKELVGEVHDDMETYQEGYDEVAEQIGNAEGLTEFVADFDNATRVSCYAEGASQVVTAGQAVVAATRVMNIPIVGWAAAALGFGAAVSAGFAADDQYKGIKESSKAIELRHMVEDTNDITKDALDENLDYYDGWMHDVEDLEIEMPDDIDVPEEITVPADNAQGQTTQTGTQTTTNTPQDEIAKKGLKK